MSIIAPRRINRATPQDEFMTLGLPPKTKPRTYSRGSDGSHPDEGEGLGGRRVPSEQPAPLSGLSFQQKWTVLSSIRACPNSDDTQLGSGPYSGTNDLARDFTI